MSGVGEEWFVENGGGGNLMSPGGVAAARAEMDRGVIRGASEKTGEGKDGIVAGAFQEATGFHTANALANEFVGPGAGFARGFVGAMEVDHDFVPGGALEELGVEASDFAMFVIEEIDLGSDDAGTREAFEESLLGVGGAEFPGMTPAPDADAAFARVGGEFAELFIGPARPKAFDDVVFEAEFASPAGEVFHVFEGVGAAIEVFPDGAAGFDPGGVDPLGKEIRVRGRSEV